MSDDPEFMTGAEHRAMDLTAELYNLICTEIIGHGPSRQGDVAELVADIHRIQHRILRQAAGRAYPDRYRMLGGPPPTEVNLAASQYMRLLNGEVAELGDTPVPRRSEQADGESDV